MNKQLETKYTHYRFLAHDAMLGQTTYDQFTGRHGTAYRYFRGVKNNWKPSVRGGYTICALFANGIFVSSGLAECSPRDSFEYRKGRKIAFGRAAKTFVETEMCNQFPGLKQAITTGYHDASGKQCPPLNSKL